MDSTTVDLHAAELANPFRPGAGHAPPYLAGRQAERDEFLRLLEQRTILDNVVLTGLRGVGKTVLLDSWKPLAASRGWAWVGADLSESTSVSEDNLAIRICTDLAPVTAGAVVGAEPVRAAGFTAGAEAAQQRLTWEVLLDEYNHTPGLSLDKMKGMLATAWAAISHSLGLRGVIFAYDEAQTLADQPTREQYPLSLLLDSFQSLQRQGLPLMLVLTGLPTLFPKLVEARTFAERMFRVVFLNGLDERESEEAIRKPLGGVDSPVRFRDEDVRTIVDMSAGYPYFLQFICREAYNAFLQRNGRAEGAPIPAAEIERKLDADFFAGRWARATDRQRALLVVISRLEGCDDEFTVREVVEESRRALDRPFSSSHTSQMLAALAAQGLVYKNRHGRYSFAVPLLGRFIRRQSAA